MNRSSYKTLFDVEDSHFWFQTRNQIIRSALSRYIHQFGYHYRVLEVGCGTGNVLRHIEQICETGLVIGMDLYPEGLYYAKNRVTCPLVQGDVRQQPFAITFQIIGLFDVLEHLENDSQLLSDLYSMLNPNGILMITVPAHNFLWSYFDELSHHFRRYAMSDIKQKLSEAGFRIEYTSYFMSLPLPFIWLGRRLNPLFSLKRQSLDDITSLSMRDLKLPPFINALVTYLLRFESKLVSLGWSILFGSSLLMIARKE